MSEHADRVRHERLRREWSVRKAAAEGKISNTYWGEFEDYRRPLTPLIAAAVALAFGWSPTWADEPAEESVSRLDAVEKEVAALRRAVRALLEHERLDAGELLESMPADRADEADRRSTS
jgi:hypothetical protein